jgi:translocation and assembly module TamB
LRSKFKNPLILTIGAILLVAILFFLLRGPYLSNSIKRVIIPALEAATKEKIIIDNTVINLFPFYIQAKGLKMFDKDGNKLLWITKARAYIDLTSIFSKELIIRKLAIREPDLIADEVYLKRIIENMKETFSGEGDSKHQISFRNIEVTGGKFDLTNVNGVTFLGEGLFFDMTAKNNITAQLKLNKGTIRTSDQTFIESGLDMRLKITDGVIEIAEININSSKSRLHAKGEVHFTSDGKLKDGFFKGNAKIHEDIIHNLYGIKTENEDLLSFDGSVDMLMTNDLKQPEFTVDLKTDSRFHLETLMEILKIKENITGKLSVTGKITGTFPELSGTGAAKLEDSELGTFRIDDAAGDVIYEDNKFSLKKIKAHAYEGEMKGDASLLLPHGDYTVSADVSHISSPKFLKFLGWEPPLPPGEVSGYFNLQHDHAQDIEVQANINYLNTSGKDGDIINRLHKVKGDLYLKKGLLRLYNSVLSTSFSDLSLDGSIDFKKKIINLDLNLDSRDMSDLTAPYYTSLIAQGKFKGTVKGPLDDPEVSGRVDVASGRVNGLMFTGASADLIYKISSLSVRKLNISQGASFYDASGTVEFRNKKGFFHFEDPYYRAKATVNDGDLKSFIKVLYRDLPVSGVVSGLLSFEGDTKKFNLNGDLIVKDSTVYGQQFEKVIVKTTIGPEDIKIHSVTAQKGHSAIYANGALFFDKKFNFTVAPSNVNLSDINILQRLSVAGTALLNMKGSGTFERPDINFSVDIPESAVKGVRTGKGRIEGILKDRDLSAKGSFMNGIVTADAKAVLSKKILWDIDFDLRKGSYDYLMSGIVKNLPKDLELSLEGKIKIKGEGEKVSLLSRFGYLTCNIYGYNFRNSSDIVLEFVDRQFMIKAFSLKGENAEISAEGIIKMNEQFDLKLNGNMDLAEFNNLSGKIASLKGSGNFVTYITGPWDMPDINGEVDVKDAMMLLNEYPYKLGPMNGTVYLKKDRFTFDSVRTVFGGGSISLSGVGYLKGLSIQRIFISSTVSGINIRPAEKFNATVDGRLYYETSEKGSKIYGNIDIIKAKYEKNVELNKWLPGYRQISKDTFRYPDFLKDTEFNVYIFGEDNIIIDNNIAKTPVRIAFTLTGNVSRFGLIGRIEADEGNIYFRSNEFKILEGSNVDFITPDRINPFFHLLAETYIGNYYVKLNLDGTMDKFTLSLFSDPPLSEMEILTLLTVGQSGKESRGLESGIATSEAASALTGGLQDLLQDNIKNITGFERFMIEPHTTTTGSVSPKVTIGKRLLEDKLFVTYSTSVGTTEESVVKLEYIIDKNISLIGSKDEIGSIGGDIKYRFEFK